MDLYTHQYIATGSHTEPWNIAGYVFVAAGAGLLVYVGGSHVARRYRTWRENVPEKGLTPAEFAAALADPDGARLLRVAAPLEPYVVELGAENVVARLAGIDAPAPVAPWTVEDDNRVRSAVRSRLRDAEQADGHPFIAVGTLGSALVFVDPAQSPGSISIDGDQNAATALAELLQRQSDEAGHDVRFVFGPAEGAQWRWTLASDGELDTDVLGVRVQTAHLATALKTSTDTSNDTSTKPDEPAKAALANTAPAKAEPSKAEPIKTEPEEPPAAPKSPADLLDRLGTLGTPPRRGAAPEQTTSAKALLVARADPHADLDAVSAADSVRAQSADLE
ncbi:hypothetical protein [Catenulispora rubra]|uniref:hypothetical protein n=1 Tax=Catenulispora rubra TaxID=280293 RepID=UPI001892464E|nr:hypothetical protein [Catenulispora rubra]